MRGGGSDGGGGEEREERDGIFVRGAGSLPFYQVELEGSVDLHVIARVG